MSTRGKGLAACAVLVALACGRVDTGVGAEHVSLYLEAESGQLSGGFAIENDPQASGGQYILPPADDTSLTAPGAASAQYPFHLGESGTYVIWGRIHGPGVDRNSFWVTVDSGPSYLWQLSTGVIWFWGRVTNGTDYGHGIDFTLSAGDHRIVVQNAVPGAGLDRLYITASSDVPPGNDTPCDPPNSIQLADGGCLRSCGSFLHTTCGVVACAGRTALRAYDCDVCCKAPDGGVDDAMAE